MNVRNGRRVRSRHPWVRRRTNPLPRGRPCYAEPVAQRNGLGGRNPKRAVRAFDLLTGFGAGLSPDRGVPDADCDFFLKFAFDRGAGFAYMGWTDGVAALSGVICVGISG